MYTISSFLCPMRPLAPIGQFIKLIFLKKCFYFNFIYSSSNRDSKCSVALLDVCASKHAQEFVILSNRVVCTLIFHRIDRWYFIFIFVFGYFSNFFLYWFSLLDLIQFVNFAALICRDVLAPFWQHVHLANLLEIWSQSAIPI